MDVVIDATAGIAAGVDHVVASVDVVIDATRGVASGADDIACYEWSTAEQHM